VLSRIDRVSYLTINIGKSRKQVPIEVFLMVFKLLAMDLT